MLLKTLDKYILKKYLGTFFFIVLMFSMLAMVIDFSEKVEDFVGPKGPTPQSARFGASASIALARGCSFAPSRASVAAARI